MELKLLIDEQLLGCGVLLKSIGYQVVLANETGVQLDTDLIEYAIQNGLFIVTEDKGMASLCKFRNVPHLHIDVSMKAKMIVDQLKRKASNDKGLEA
jgi:predicted nuclease of predicted toxin-antitoxin system